jgi:hypothetical protein
MHKIKQYMKIGVSVALGIGILAYGLFETRFLWKTIRLQVSAITSDTGTVHIEGTAPKSSAVAINGRPITITRDGTFTESIMLLPGYNTITVSKRGQFGKEEVKTENIYYQPNEVSLAQNMDTHSYK